MAVRLVYETHSTTLDNEAGVCTGWQPGSLSAAGIRNAEQLGTRRRDDGIDLVVSSDLHRAVQTVDIAFADSPVPRRTDPRLREVDFGELTGAPIDVVHAQRRRRVDVPFPGGQSYRQVVEGVRELLGELARDHDGERMLLVGHAATRYALDHLLTGRPLARAAAAPFAWREGWEYVLEDRLPTIEVLDGPGALAVLDELNQVYRTAFAREPYAESDERVRQIMTEQLPRHAGWEGFRCAVVRERGRLLGFCYGFTGRAGQWWTDQVTARVSEALAREWMGGHLEVVELAVDPVAQGRGFGAALVDLLLEGAEEERALLCTWPRGDGRLPAPRLYARLGWELLQEEVLPDRDLWGVRIHG
ncbi:MAG TPA: GNAT family N-acetyltransferase [Actinomycetes bacterium]|nr:GNAT family N-acetyltransferase [Actinomycetes bacterium]